MVMGLVLEQCMVMKSPLKGAPSSVIYLWPASSIIALFKIKRHLFFFRLPKKRHTSREIIDAELPSGADVGFCMCVMSREVMVSHPGSARNQYRLMPGRIGISTRRVLRDIFLISRHPATFPVLFYDML